MRFRAIYIIKQRSKQEIFTSGMAAFIINTPKPIKHGIPVHHDQLLHAYLLVLWEQEKMTIGKIKLRSQRMMEVLFSYISTRWEILIKGRIRY